jgi:hypothetical protein
VKVADRDDALRSGASRTGDGRSGEYSNAENPAQKGLGHQRNVAPVTQIGNDAGFS